MSSRFWTVLLTLALAGSLLAGPADAGASAAAGKKKWAPAAGGFFNDPWGDIDAKYRIERQIVAAIRHAHKGSYIRIAVYSFDRTNVAQALIDAHKRGVHVQVLHNDHQYTKAMKMLKHALGTNRGKKSWDYTCKTGCRSVQGVLHDKIYLFDHTGSARDVVMTGSANLTKNATAHQFNDLLIQKGVPDLARTMLELFRHLKKDKTDKPLYWHRVINKSYRLWVMPHPHTNVRNDPIMDILRPVQCRGVGRGVGINGRTKIRVSMHAWNGDRGVYIARRLRHLYAQGCNVKVMWALAGSGMKKVIGMDTRRGKVRRHANGYNTDCDPEHTVDMYSHQKYMTISGHYGKDRTASLVFTGSSNWTHSGISGDELILRASGPNLVNSWNRNFDHIWTKRSRPVGAGGGFRPDPPDCQWPTGAERRATAHGLTFGGAHWEDD
ncbi:phospholipase D-like domain-containing protein [Nocardioides sp. URHA0032]|uniref:phospholipase D-like domain-containing protein n=1 Tax=Nocardioides sp. URHA0032 TaxID=1380388 RepID=UPI0012DF42C5|nr:phospholipase D-like domain-containing protein [Nocardioides sp. URHA0032]